MTFSCERCGYKTTFRSNFRRHVFTGSCQATLSDIDVVRLQERLDDDKPYTCNDCGKRLKTRKGYHLHMLTVHGEPSGEAATGMVDGVDVGTTVSNVEYVNDFGKESNNISLQFAYDCAMKGLVPGVLDMVQHIYGSPQNTTVRWKSEKSIWVMNDRKWDVCGLTETVRRMVINAASKIVTTLHMHCITLPHDVASYTQDRVQIPFGMSIYDFRALTQIYENIGSHDRSHICAATVRWLKRRHAGATTLVQR